MSRSAPAREKHPRTPSPRADSYVDGRTSTSEARRTINQGETNQSILAELVAHLRAENADQRRSFAARLEAKDSQVGYSRYTHAFRVVLTLFSGWRIDCTTGS